MRNKISITLILVLILLFLWFFFGTEDAPQYETITTERGDLLQEVSVTGKLKASELVDLSFERSGKVSSIRVDIGNEVEEGVILMSLSNADLAAKVAEARSGLKSEEAELDGLVRGSREEEIAVSQAEVEVASIGYLDAERTLRESISDVFTKSDDAIRTQADQFFNSVQSQSPQLSFGTEQSLQAELEISRSSIEDMLDTWADSISLGGDLIELGTLSLENIATIKTFLEKAALALSNATLYSSISQTDVDAYNADISSARTAVSASASSLVSAIGDVETTQANLSLAEKELALTEAGTSEEDIRAQEAVVESAEALVLIALAEFEKTVIRAPFTGVITKVGVEIGETVAANTYVVSLISPLHFEIETFIPEADIAKIKIEDKAEVTLDAYDADLFFDAYVVSIDPAETVIEGVSTYKVVFEFIDEEELGKSGMTANVDVLTNSRENVISVPARSIETKNGEKFVRVLSEDGVVSERVIKTGLRGSDGRVEVTSGIEDGEQIILFFE